MNVLFNYKGVAFLILIMTISCERISTKESISEEIIEKKIFLTASPLDVSFVDKNVGFIAGSCEFDFSPKVAVVGKTTDGGDTWDVIPVMFDQEKSTIIRSIYALNEDTVFATFTSVFEAVTDHGICIGTNGGITWNKLYSFNYGSTYSGVVFIDKNCGFIIGNGDIYKTGTGGIEWSKVYEYVGMFGAPRDIISPSEQVGYAYGFSSGDNYVYSTLVKTADGGNTWRKLPSIKNDAISSLVFANELIGYAFTINNYVYKTIDGGESWDLLNNLLKYGGASYYSAVIVGSVIYFGSGPSLFRTDNNFKTVRKIFTSADLNTILSVKAVQTDTNRIIFLSSNQSIIIVSIKSS